MSEEIKRLPASLTRPLKFVYKCVDINLFPVQTVMTLTDHSPEDQILTFDYFDEKNTLQHKKVTYQMFEYLIKHGALTLIS